jgi:molybdopterin synthase sulfur carrier subunit
MAAVKVRIPTPLRKITKDLEEVDAQGTNITEIIADLETNYPGLKERICEDDGSLRRFVNLYLNDEDIRFKENMDTALNDGDELSIIPAIAGGRG